MKSIKNSLKQVLAFILVLVMAIAPLQLLADGYEGEVQEQAQYQAFIDYDALSPLYGITPRTGLLYFTAGDVNITRGATFVDIHFTLENNTGNQIGNVAGTLELNPAVVDGLMIPTDTSTILRNVVAPNGVTLNWVPNMPDNVLFIVVNGNLAPGAVATFTIRLTATADLEVGETDIARIARPVMGSLPTADTLINITRRNSTITIDVDEDGDVDVDVPPIWEEIWDGDTYDVGDDDDGNITVTFPPGTDPDDIEVNLPCDDDWDYSIDVCDETGDVIVTIYPPRHEIFVQKTSNVSTANTTVFAGEYIVYTIFVRNDGSVAANNLVIQDTLSANTTFVESSHGTHTSGVVSHTILSLAPDASFTMTVRVRVNDSARPGDAIVNNVVISGPGIDPLDPPGDNDRVYVGNIVIDVESDRSTSVAGAPDDDYTITGDGPNDIGNIYVSFPEDTNHGDIEVNLPNNEWSYRIIDCSETDRVVVIITPPVAFTLTFHLYLDNDHHQHVNLLRTFEDYATGISSDGFLTIVVPVNPGHPANRWLGSDLLADARGIGHIYGTAGSAGHAFWGWFRRGELPRTSDATGMGRPALSSTCALAGLITSIENATTTTALNSLFGSATSGNIDLFSIWSLWGDVNDDDNVCQLDLNTLTLYIMLTVPGIADVVMNKAAANVIVDDQVCQLDLNLLTLHVMLEIPGIMPVPLGVRADD